jgi:tetratricopeptide (TPR) repeat protein
MAAREVGSALSDSAEAKSNRAGALATLKGGLYVRRLAMKHYLRGLGAFYGKKDFNLAIRECQTAKSLDGTIRDCDEMIVMALYRANRFEEAEQAYGEAVASGSVTDNMSWERVTTLLENERNDAAVGAAELYLQTAKQPIRAHLVAALSFFVAGMLERAHAAFDVAVEARPFEDRIDDYLTAAFATYLERYADAKAAIELYMSSGIVRPDQKAYLGWARFGCGEIEAGRETFVEILKESPHEALLWYHFAQAEVRWGSIDDGIKWLRRALVYDISLRDRAGTDDAFTRAHDVEAFRRLFRV